MYEQMNFFRKRAPSIPYFAYGSNMNLHQMALRCPDAKPIGAVRLDGFKLIFAGNAFSAVATIVPDKNSHVDGVLWHITQKCERSLDHYEGYPNFYGKTRVIVKNTQGVETITMTYTMQAPHKDKLGVPSKTYANGILQGARQNGVDVEPIQNRINEAWGDFGKPETPKRNNNIER